ncbi:hypothetical protein [Ancylobacter amanitiformis]|uniref:Uncharacterized protein n=1 Tax=Ancylobacter amanitiformis TaxID=217069 RepID=A0ABU0LQE8_9HYPH|nr:hypothetical protein [Ancylobacter amanitiformis]MDQ0510936.1 hypothetical protein [Ancylobacter amanitiformis]
MQQDLHGAIREAVREHVVARGQKTGDGMVFDAAEVAEALVQVLAEVIVSGHPAERGTFTATIHQALDEAVVDRAAASQVPYPVLPP